jgi:hypothetical protein
MSPSCRDLAASECGASVYRGFLAAVTRKFQDSSDIGALRGEEKWLTY